jgi:hypothetical protein
MQADLITYPKTKEKRHDQQNSKLYLEIRVLRTMEATDSYYGKYNIQGDSRSFTPT